MASIGFVPTQALIGYQNAKFTGGNKRQPDQAVGEAADGRVVEGMAERLDPLWMFS